MNNVLIGAVLGFLGGLVGISLSSGSPQRIVNRVVLIVAAIEAVASVLLWSFSEISDVGTILAVLMSSLMIRSFRSYSHAEYSALAASAEELRDFVLRNFQAFDMDGDGSITRLDLWEVRETHRFDEKDLLLIRQLDRYLWLIGHVVDSMIGHTPMMGAPMSGGAMYVERHGVSREDLKRWPAKAAQEYARRFKE